MSGPEEDTEKPYEATPRKLEEARKRGEIPKSNDLITAGGFLGFFLAAGLFGASSLQQLGTLLTAMIAQSHEFAPVLLGDGGRSLGGGLIGRLFSSLSPWLILPALTALVVILAQRSLTFSGKKLEFKLSRISIIANFKNRFGRAGLFEFAKSFSKLIIISCALGFFLRERWPNLMRSMALEANAGAAVMLQLSLGFLTAVIGIFTLIGIIDFLWQYAEHLRKNRMSHQELKDETKQSEGDPYLKQERRERGMSIAANRMMAEVPDADVVLINPEHYAVALKWDRSPGSAPVCVAKGVDHIALKIRETATEAGVPIHRDPPTARALYATTELDQQIAPEHYRAVAAAIRFAEKMREKAKHRDGSRL
ncbi:MAG: flagellar type III secretion system protein FlhB [Mangrovicoccus sp.]|nr:flagellar type III secretion system protein FlhB [Mangrovicoccus sp.]